MRVIVKLVPPKLLGPKVFGVPPIPVGSLSNPAASPELATVALHFVE